MEVDAKPVDGFHQLVRDLSDALGPSSGLDSDEVDPSALQLMMENYLSEESEWDHYALVDPSKNYTRNLVDEGNGKSNLVCSAFLTYSRSSLIVAAPPRLDTRSRQPYPRSCQCALHHEGTVSLFGALRFIQARADLEGLLGGDYLSHSPEQRSSH